MCAAGVAQLVAEVANGSQKRSVVGLERNGGSVAVTGCLNVVGTPALPVRVSLVIQV